MIRHLKRYFKLAVITGVTLLFFTPTSTIAQTIEQYEIFELTFKGPVTGNPFTDVILNAEFRFKNRVLQPEGFYDGNGIYKIRFMPDEAGEWTWITSSNIKELNTRSGKFTCSPARTGNRGPVSVRDVFHFGYADGTPFYPVGTTCYAWVHQPDDLVQQTLATLSKTTFNKIRMTVMPKNYDVYINNEPPFYPFEGSKEKGWDFSRPNPDFFRNFEQKILELQKLGIEADVILFHPYDFGKWNFDKMNHEQAKFYLRYLIARIAAYRNVWWSMANEYDIMGKTEKEWDDLFRVIQTYDPYRHLCSIHNGMAWYNHSKPWITHLSIQTPYLQGIQDWRELYHKPVIIDECVYEGNIPNDWGNLTPEEMVNRFWISWCRGAYCTHGETYMHPQNILWWSKGGTLYGKSPERIAFLHRIMTETPMEGVHPFHNEWNKETYLIKDNEFYLFYYGNSQQAKARLYLPDNVKFKLEIIDAWNMTITPVEGEFSGLTEIPLPGLPYIAVRATAIKKVSSYVTVWKRFFSDSSFWNRPIGENPEIDPGSDYFISLLAKDPRHQSFGINTNRYTIPVFEVDSTAQPVVFKKHYLSENEKVIWKTDRQYLGHGKAFDSLPVPLPAGATPDSAGDMHLAIIDWKTMTAWDMWGARKLADGSWESNTGMRYRLDGPGVFDLSDTDIKNGESVHFHGPGRASGVPIIAGLIMFGEVEAGEIRHKIAAASRFNAFQEFVFPATWTDGQLVNGIPEGAVIQLDPALDLSQFDLKPGELAVARALQVYGMVLVDWAGGNVLYAENLNNDKSGRSWNGILRDYDGGIIDIPVKYYRVLKLNNIINKGDAKHKVDSGIPGI